MLEINDLIQHRLKLVLTVPFQLTTCAVSKNLVMPKVFSIKILEFNSRHQSFSLKVMFILMLKIYSKFAKKHGGKKNAIGFVGSGGVKIVFIQLVKPLVIYI